MKTEHILIIRFSAIGDVAMTVPVVYSLAQQYPHVRITMLSRPSAQPFFQDLAPNVSFMGADIKGEYKGIKGLNSLYRRLTAKNFTAVADLHNVIRSDYLRMRFNIDRYKVAHIDKHRDGKRQLIAENNKVFRQQPTSFQNYADVFAKLGYPVKINFTSIFPKEGGNLRLLSEAIGEKKGFPAMDRNSAVCCTPRKDLSYREDGAGGRHHQSPSPLMQNILLRWRSLRDGHHQLFGREISK